MYTSNANLCPPLGSKLQRERIEVDVNTCISLLSVPCFKLLIFEFFAPKTKRNQNRTV